MSHDTHGYCARCERDVEIEHRYPQKLRNRLRLYLYMPLLLLPFFPILASDYVLALPMLMLYMLGIGPVLRIVREPGECCECGAMVDGGRRGSTRPVPTPSTP